MPLQHRIFALTLLILTMSACSSVPKKQITTSDWHQAKKQVINQYSPTTEPQLRGYFERAGVAYPPKEIALLTFKKERKMELWARDNRWQWQRVRDYRLTANSGTLGPKLKENDLQIPEGVYRITHLNPFSDYHLSMMLNYPNETDRKHAKLDGRSQDTLGNNIFIHGKALSAGCIAVGDRAINELFILVGRVGAHNVRVIISPNDMRQRPPMKSENHPTWVTHLYADINRHLQPFAIPA